MTFYYVAGSVNSMLIMLSVIGIFSQYLTIIRRKRQGLEACQQLSLNQFSVSFLAYWSFFIYGYCIAPFNHFIVWPRLIASLLVCAILWQIWQSRRSSASRVSWIFSVLALGAGMGVMVAAPQWYDEGKWVSQWLILAITLLLAQGYWHQIRLIWTKGATGAVDLKMSVFILAMDISTLVFVAAMGLDNGWPLLCLASVSGMTKIAIIYLFYWVKTSPLAAARRQAYEE